MDAGRLVHRVDLVKDVVTRVNGVEVKTPTTYATSVPALVTYLAGNEAWRAHQIDASINVSVLMRYRTDVQPSHRIIYRGKSLEVKAPPTLDEEFRQQVVVQCKG